MVSRDAPEGPLMGGKTKTDPAVKGRNLDSARGHPVASRKPVLEEVPCINLYAEPWRKALRGVGIVSGEVEWPEWLCDSFFHLGEPDGSGVRILSVALPAAKSIIQEIPIGPHRRGCFDTLAAWCPVCARRSYKLYAQAGVGPFVCFGCASLQYASHRFRDLEEDECVRDPTGYLKRRAAYTDLRSVAKTMRTLERARARIIKKQG